MKVTVIVDTEDGTRFILDENVAIAVRLDRVESMPIAHFHRLLNTEVIRRKSVRLDGEK